MMSKFTTILIGNGLGMAINPTQFSINSGLHAAWNKIDVDTQDRIKSLMKSNSLDNEDQLDAHYPAIHACQMLGKVERASNFLWLDKDARDFPRKFSNYIEDVAKYFFDYTIEIEKLIAFNDFVKNLSKYISNHRIHLVTLNYDKLLYGQFINDTQIMHGKDGKLLDGFYVGTTGFNPTILDNKKDDQGFYLHLHGSPLFYTDISNNKIDKSKILPGSGSYKKEEHLVREHLILCNTKHKFAQITASPILRTYWEYFNLALKRSEKVILFGYSGNDIHVNKAIKEAEHLQITIVEYGDAAFTLQDRKEFWSEKLNIPIKNFNEKTFQRLVSIIDYTFDE